MKLCGDPPPSVYYPSVLLWSCSYISLTYNSHLWSSNFLNITFFLGHLISVVLLWDSAAGTCSLSCCLLCKLYKHWATKWRNPKILDRQINFLSMRQRHCYKFLFILTFLSSFLTDIWCKFSEVSIMYPIKVQMSLKVFDLLRFLILTDKSICIGKFRFASVLIILLIKKHKGANFVLLSANWSKLNCEAFSTTKANLIYCGILSLRCYVLWHFSLWYSVLQQWNVTTILQLRLAEVAGAESFTPEK